MHAFGDRGNFPATIDRRVHDDASEGGPGDAMVDLIICLCLFMNRSAGRAESLSAAGAHI